jgi:RNA polymerase sigma-54 factor
LPQVATESGLGLERVKFAMSKMHELTISPGRMLAAESVLPVIPDAIVEFDDRADEYIVAICNGNLPTIRISNAYEKMLTDTHSDESTRNFIKRNLNSARWILEAVGQRKTTLLNVVKIVVDRQREFLDQGDAFLRPLPMIEVADMLGIHVATVSRAVADKWIQTPRGIFRLRRFFSGGYDSDQGGEMSWEAVKTRLKEIVEAEDKKSPLSDEAIAKSLRTQGIEIARRTVVKYRQQLSIPAARLRKEY